MPKNAPAFGCRVRVRYRRGEERAFCPKSEEAVFLAWDDGVVHGAFCAKIDPTGGIGGDHMAITRVSAPRPWSSEIAKETWKIASNPF